MDSIVYDRMNELEARHWWFVARRRIIASLIRRAMGKRSGRILEAGCGSGGNLQMLRNFGEVDAFEFYGPAREEAMRKSGLTIPFGALPDALPFAGSQYDLIGLFDVLEHIRDDVGSLAALGERLGEGGKILVTVPALPLLWSGHDVRHHHFRRYTRSTLAEAAAKAGLKVSYSSYFNFFLFPLAVTSRGMKRLAGSDAPDDRMPADWVNRLFTRIFGTERHLLGRVRLPIGLSLAAVLEKA